MRECASDEPSVVGQSCITKRGAFDVVARGEIHVLRHVKVFPHQVARGVSGGNRGGNAGGGQAPDPYMGDEEPF